MFKRIAGTKDILPQETDFWLKIEKISRRVFSLYNYRQIRPPLIEEAALFNRSLGESAEIVQKQMFLIRNNSELYALRPEGTASVVRAYVENNLEKKDGLVKLYYTGPMFRLERPQKARLRQFHHLGCEVIGAYQPYIDIEVISLADRLLKDFGIGGYKVRLNSLGCAKDKSNLSSILYDKLKIKLNELCSDCQARFERNSLRILDCKNESCQVVVQGLEIGNGHLCQECRIHFEQVKQGLTLLGVDYSCSEYLVRGLDYYTRTVFEFTHPDLGRQQDALGAGGRYDNLVGDLGGNAAGAIGFAFGMERLLMVSGPLPTAQSNDLVYLITMGEAARKTGITILRDLRQAGISADTDYENRSLKGAMRRANDLGAASVLILGDNELQNKSITLKDLTTGNQREVAISTVVQELLINREPRTLPIRKAGTDHESRIK
ncbi:MAG: histidine--tRNA ligase [Candidatus Omnitrophota bacterium]|nr:histidine--tRNA ligase [Candidatus Omnitrophota bacterium]